MTAQLKSTIQDIHSAYRAVLSGRLDAHGQQLVLLSHFGEFNPVKIDHLLRLTESAILEQGDKRQVMKRVYSVLVEILQNMAIHATRDRDNRMYGYVILTRDENHYIIESGNLVMAESRESIARRINELNTLDSAQLRKAYVDTLCNENFTDKGGAGLGMLTLAKRASRPILFRIDPLEGPFAYLHMTVALDNV
ncbi:MAG: SiaB family protein kinase [Flavobacteriales bacterium]